MGLQRALQHRTAEARKARRCQVILRIMFGLCICSIIFGGLVRYYCIGGTKKIPDETPEEKTNEERLIAYTNLSSKLNQVQLSRLHPKPESFGEVLDRKRRESLLKQTSDGGCCLTNLCEMVNCCEKQE